MKKLREILLCKVEERISSLPKNLADFRCTDVECSNCPFSKSSPDGRTYRCKRIAYRCKRIDGCPASFDWDKEIAEAPNKI